MVSAESDRAESDDLKLAALDGREYWTPADFWLAASFLYSCSFFATADGTVCVLLSREPREEAEAGRRLVETVELLLDNCDLGVLFRLPMRVGNAEFSGSSSTKSLLGL